MDDKNFQLSKLIERVKNKEEGAFEELYERYVKLVYYLAYKSCNNEADSKDILQETFMEVQRSIHSLQNPEAFKFWLNRIVLSKAMNLFRKNKYKLVDEDQIYAKHHLVEEREYILPEKSVRKKTDKEVLMQIINTLPLGQQQVLTLFYLEQFSIHEVAALLELSEGTVKSRLSYARATMKKKIEQYEHVNDIQLTFHSLGGAIASAMIAEVATLQLPKATIALTLLPKKWLAPFQSVATTAVSKIALVTLCLGGASIGGGYAVEAWNKYRSEMPKEVVQEPEKQADEMPFPKMEVLGREITTAKAAYFNLRFVACCEEEIKQLTPQQLQDIKAIHTTLKDINSPYYQTLLDEGWLSNIENLANK